MGRSTERGPAMLPQVSGAVESTRETQAHEASAMEDKASPCTERTEYVPPVGRVFFPLDEELGLLPGNLAPRQHEHVVHLASWMPFAWAVRMLDHLLGVQVSEETARRL